MKLKSKILIFFFAWMIFISPVLAVASSIHNNPSSKVMENCCKMDDSQSTVSNSHQENTNNNDCKKDCSGCTSNACYTSNMPILVYVENIKKWIESTILFELKSKNRYYQLLNIKEFSFRFWNPPKYIS